MRALAISLTPLRESTPSSNDPAMRDECDVSNGVPRGLRMTVYDVLSSLAAGMTHQDILTEFFYLTEDGIRACLSYAADRERQMVTTGV